MALGSRGKDTGRREIHGICRRQPTGVGGELGFPVGWIWECREKREMSRVTPQSGLKSWMDNGVANMSESRWGRAQGDRQMRRPSFTKLNVLPELEHKLRS